MSNLPPGCSDSMYGAPWNDIEIEREVEVVLKTYITVSFPGPDKSIDESDIENAIKEIVKEDLAKIDYDIEDIIIN